MPTYTVTPDGFHTLRVTGTRPFHKEQTGGENGAFEVRSADNKPAKILLPLETQSGVFAEGPAETIVDDIVSLANAAAHNTALPAITGTAKVDETLTVSNGTWAGSPTYTRQWFIVDGEDLEGETGATLDVTEDLVGKKVAVRVTGTNDSGSQTVTTVASATIAEADPE